MLPQDRLIRLIDPMTATALIGAGASVAGGLVNGVGSVFTAKKNRKFAHDEAVLARQHAEDMYNKYSSPSAQRQQMLEAGLSPMGAISPQAVGTSTSASTPSASPPDFGSALTGGFAGFVQGKQLAMQLKTQKLANDNAAEELTTKRLNNQILAIDAGNYEEYKKITMEMLQHDRDFKKLSKQEQELKVQQMFEASKNGWNPFNNDQRAADDAHTASEDAHNAAASALNQSNELHELNKKLLNGQISSQSYTNTILNNQSIMSNTKTLIRSEFNVDYDSLPDWLRHSCIEAINLKVAFDALPWSNLDDIPPHAQSKNAEKRKAFDDFQNALDSFEFTLHQYVSNSQYDSSYSNRKSEDTKSQNAVNQSNWDRESTQRELDNYLNTLQAAAAFANTLN